VDVLFLSHDQSDHIRIHEPNALSSAPFSNSDSNRLESIESLSENQRMRFVAALAYLSSRIPNGMLLTKSAADINGASLSSQRNVCEFMDVLQRISPWPRHVSTAVSAHIISSIGLLSNRQCGVDDFKVVYFTFALTF
jgi:hypothetical protein